MNNQIYGYQLPDVERAKLTEEVKRALNGIVANDRINQETEIIMCGTIYQIKTLLKGVN